jgi:hypothetical protein
MRRFILTASVIACLAIPAGLAGGSSTAFAASSVSCKALKGTISSGVITGKGCTPKDKLNKTFTGSTTALAGGTGTLTWSPSAKTTIIHTTVSGGTSQGLCGKGYIEYDATGTVTGGTSTYTHVGDVVSGKACVNGAKGKITLVKGTFFLL